MDVGAACWLRATECESASKKWCMIQVLTSGAHRPQRCSRCCGHGESPVHCRQQMQPAIQANGSAREQPLCSTWTEACTEMFTADTQSFSSMLELSAGETIRLYKITPCPN